MARMHLAVALALLFAGADAFVAPSRWTGRSAPLKAATLEKNDGGLEYVQLTHESGAKSQVYLFGGDVTQASPSVLFDFSPSLSLSLSHTHTHTRVPHRLSTRTRTAPSGSR